MRWVILGCGYTGERLAARVGAAALAVVSRPGHAAELTGRGVRAQAADVRDRAALGAIDLADAVVVDSVPTGERPHTAAVAEAARAQGARRVVYLSATSVYGRGDGGWVDEDTPVHPDAPRGRARLAEEEALLGVAGVDALVLRVAAIYGPGRGVHERLRAGTYRVVGAGDTWTSRVHVDDLVTAVLAAGTAPSPPRRVYVVADDEPTTARAYADGVAAALGLPPPASMPVSAVPPESADLVLGNRRVRNARLKGELGVRLAYPTWREGLRAILDGC